MFIILLHFIVFHVVTRVKGYLTQDAIGFVLNRYSLEDSSQFFSLDGSTGELRTLRPLDRETTAVYHLRVNCLDRNGGDGSRRAQVNVTVHVDDQNDNAPQFDRSVYEIRISDNANAGTARTGQLVLFPLMILPFCGCLIT